MSKITRNQLTKPSKSSISTYLMLFLLFAGYSATAQLIVKSNTVFTANNVVSSKEEANIFDSSVLGDDQLLLNGQNQSLATAEYSSLPTLRIINANELEIRTAVTLRNDLIVESGVLKLDKPLTVEGEIIINDSALIFNAHFIIHKKQFVFHKDFTNTTTVEMLTSVPLLVSQQPVAVLSIYVLQKESIISINESIKNLYKTTPFSPPPEFKTVC